MPIAVLTGGTGIVGSALIQHIAAELPDYRIVLLTRRPERAHANHGTAVFADIEQPDLAMDDDAKAQIRSRAALFIHCAADTRFNLPVEQARLTNADGTRHMLRLALSCPRVAQFAHISTLYVAGRRQGLIMESPLRHSAGYVNTYEETKHEAEDIVLAECGRLPVGIYRLGSVVDEAGSGGHFRQAIRFVPWWDQFPFFPADPSVPVDLISAKWAARALSVLIARCFTPGRIRHVCAGEGESMPVRDVMDMVFGAYEASVEISVRRPRLVSLPEFEGLCARLRPGSGVTRALAGMMTFVPHLSIAQPFDCTFTAELLRDCGVRREAMGALISRVLAEEFRCAAV